MIELAKVSKSFGPVRALTELSVTFSAGEIHGLIGENGAGKSTAIKIITGLLRPDDGELRVRDRVVSFTDCRDALAAGIGVVSQEISVLPDASVAENIMIDKLATRAWGVVDWGETRRRALAHLATVGLTVPADRLVRDLSPAQKQLVQIAKALSAKISVLLLDEPTSTLTEHEARRLFDVVRALRDRGVAIVFVSHKLDEVMALCDRVTVLRDGRHVATTKTSGISIPELVRQMLGREASDDHLGVLAPDYGTEVLRADNIVRAGKARGASFTLHRGEILGFYGLVGAGRTELARILIGEEPMDSGRLVLRGQIANVRNTSDSVHRYRLGYLSENRKEDGLFLHDSIEANVSIGAWTRLRHPVTRCIQRTGCAELTDRLMALLRIKAPDRHTTVAHLSGGNQQKVCLAKWVAAECDILIIDEPSVGVDIGARQQLHQLIWDLAAREGKSIIVISSDLPELVRLVNRLLVFREQRIVGEVRDVDVRRKTYAEVSGEVAPYLA